MSFLRRAGYSYPTDDSALSCVLQYSHSQNGEDALLLPMLQYISKYLPGVFVEIGANDGLYMSNTFMLERCFNWTGLLIEANPKTFRVLRYVKNKGCRSAQIVHSAACAKSGTLRVTTGGGVTSGEPDEMKGDVARQPRSIRPSQRQQDYACAMPALGFPHGCSRRFAR